MILRSPRDVDGRLMTTLRGDRIVAEFLEILNNYVQRTYAEAVLETAAV